MAIENAKQNVIYLFYLFLSTLKNINVAPIKVESPAIVDTKSGISVLFIFIPYSSIFN